MKSINVIHSSVVSLIVRYQNKSITFRDSFNILPSSLRKLTNDFNVEHKKLELDYEAGADDPRLKEYLENDLKGLHEVLMCAIELTDKLTIASNSMNVFLKKFYMRYPRGNYVKFDNVFRNAYYGGRVEIFKMVGKDLKYYDVNSLYPYVMHKYSYPLIDCKNYQYTSDYIKGRLGIYNISAIAPPNLHIPVLPFRLKTKLIFPVGRVGGWYHSPEIEKAVEVGYKVNVHYGYVFKETDYIFRNFVEHYYKIKKEAKGSRREIAKLYLNSLYGKFGQKREQDVYEVKPHSDYNYKGTEVIYPFAKFGIHKKKKFLTYDRYIHSEIAGLITSYARLELYSLFEKAGAQNVYYCDTDSVITSSELPESPELGGLKKEADIDNFIAVSPKVYAYTENGKEHIKAKGISSKNLKYQNFKDAIEKKDLSAFISEFERLTTFKEKNIRKFSNYSDKIKVKKMLRSFYDKRIITSSYDTKPLHV